MPIAIRCNCGMSFSVPDAFAGKRAKCKTCGEVICIPLATPPSTSMPLEPAVPVAEPVRPMPTVARPVSPQPTVPPHVDPAAEKALQHFNRTTKSAASNPGKLLVNPFLYTRAYPFAFVLCSICVLVSLLLSFLHELFVLALVGSLLLSWRVWFKTRFDFVGGCINPGVVISLDPPLVAVSTNLGKANDRPEGTPIIFIGQQPLKHMLDGMPQIGQRVATVATYGPDSDFATHWDGCDPKLPACVTHDRVELDRIYQSIDESDWLQLEQTLRQIPPSPEIGDYRVFLDDPPAPTDAWLDSRLQPLIEEMLLHDPESNQLVASRGIPPKSMRKAQEEFAKNIPASLIMAVCGTSFYFHGVIITRPEIIFDFDDEPLKFRWQDMRGALYTSWSFEITTRDFRRTRIATRKLRDNNYRIEALINTVATSDRDGWRPWPAL